ncbi:MAG: hypothetical protein QUS08_08025 [Methanothrix sp.]|nr:hypothetical protein [Methanothrix sp.]
MPVVGIRPLPGRTPLLVGKEIDGMPLLRITDIRGSCDRGSDLITAIILDEEPKGSRPLDGRNLLMLESATAEGEMPAIGAHSGDQYIRMLAKPGHGLSVGEVIRLDGV